MKKITLLSLLVPFLILGQTQIGLDIDGEAEADQSSYSISMSSNGNRIAIGGVNNDDDGNNFTETGHVRVYENINSTWTQLGEDLDGAGFPDHFGYSVSLSANGNILAVSSDINTFPNSTADRYKGAVKLYEFNTTTSSWEQFGQEIIGDEFHDNAGREIELSSDGYTVAIGADGNDDNGPNSGNVRVYRFNTATNLLEQLGQDINGEASGNESGANISLSANGNIIAIAAKENFDNGSRSGQVRLYEFNTTTNLWVQLGQDLNGEMADVQFGIDVGLSSNGLTVAVGALYSEENGIETGNVRVFEYNGLDTWNQVGNNIFDTNEYFTGFTLSLSGDGSIVAVSNIFNDNNGNNSGLVRLYKNISGVWTQIGTDINGESANDNSGTSLSLSEDATTLAIGALANDGNGSASGHVRVFDISAVTLSIEENVLSNFSLYPNPTTNQFTIQLNSTSILEQVTIYNTLGQMVLTSEEAIVNTSKLASGSYIVEITTNTGKASKKLIIE